MRPEMFRKKGGFDKTHQKAESHVHNDASLIKPALQVPTLWQNI